MKAKVDKLDINKLVNLPTSLNNLKTKIDYLDIGKLKSVLADLKKLSDVVSREVVKNAKFNTPNSKGSNLEIKIPDASTLIETNKSNIDKQNFEKYCRYWE